MVTRRRHHQAARRVATGIKACAEMYAQKTISSDGDNGMKYISAPLCSTSLRRAKNFVSLDKGSVDDYPNSACSSDCS